MTYSQRVWLNKPESNSTGSVVAFDGMVDYGDAKGPEPFTFLEIADCHGKIKLHKSHTDTKEDFIKKMELLKNTVEDFLKHLKDDKSCTSGRKKR